MSSTVRQVPLTCSGHTRPVVDLHFAQRLNTDDILLISACKDGKPMLRDGVTGDWIGTFEGHKGAVWSVCLAGSGHLAASGSADFTARVWDTSTGLEKLQLTHKHIVRAVALSTDGAHLSTGSADKLIRRFDISAVLNPVAATGENEDASISTEPTETLHGHTGSVQYLRLLGDGRRLISVGDDRTVRVWDPSTGEGGGLIRTINLPVRPQSLELTSAGDKFVMAVDKKVQIWCTNTYQMIKEILLPCPTYAASLHPDGHWLVCGGEDFRLYKMDVETGNELESFKGHFGPVHCCAFSPDGRLYASGSEDGTVRLWQTVVGTTYGLWRFVEGVSSSVSQQEPAAPPSFEQEGSRTSTSVTSLGSEAVNGEVVAPLVTAAVAASSLAPNGDVEIAATSAVQNDLPLVETAPSMLPTVADSVTNDEASLTTATVDQGATAIVDSDEQRIDENVTDSAMLRSSESIKKGISTPTE